MRLVHRALVGAACPCAGSGRLLPGQDGCLGWVAQVGPAHWCGPHALAGRARRMERGRYPITSSRRASLQRIDRSIEMSCVTLLRASASSTRSAAP